MIAVAHIDGVLQDLVVKWEPNLSKLVQSFIPKASGRKPGPRRNRLSRAPEQGDVGQLEDPLEDVTAFDKPEPYYLRWLEGSTCDLFFFLFTAYNVSTVLNLCST